jgi:hypothetical protein
MVSTILRMKNLHSSTASYYIVRNKKCLEDLFVFQQQFVHTVFLELSMAHLLKKFQDFIIYRSRDRDILTHPEYRKIEK